MLMRRGYAPRVTDVTVFQEVARVAELHPDRIALETRRGEEWVRISYAELVDLCWRDAERLVNMGIGRGTTVALSCDNRPEWLRTYLAVSATGAATISYNDELGEDDLQAALENAHPIAVIASTDSLARLSPTLRAELATGGVLLLDLEHELELFTLPAQIEAA